MKLDEKLKPNKKPIMVLGTSSGAGKSLTVTAICRLLKKFGEKPIPFKGQNMSNNAWVDCKGGEMAYSQALQAFACKITPTSEMNPILLKPQGNSISEVIHLGESMGTTTAKDYYKDWFIRGREVIKKSLNSIYKQNPNCRLIVEGAGSPVEMNLIHRDLTNLKIAKYLKANCILITDIERGGIFAQIIGTLELMKPEERSLVKGIIVNRFRGDISLFEEGKQWIEDKTNIPILGIMPWLKDIYPPEDSLDLLNLNPSRKNIDLKVGVIKLKSISNFSDIDPLNREQTLDLNWINESKDLSDYDLIIIPGSKQTIKDYFFLKESNLIEDIRNYAKNEGNIFGICGGLQLLGKILEDPFNKEGGLDAKKKSLKGIGLLPLKTKFQNKKITQQTICKSTWPCKTLIKGFEMHNGVSVLMSDNNLTVHPMFEESNLGWFIDKGNNRTLAGVYIHGIFENDLWRESYINLIRKQKDLPKFDRIGRNYKLGIERLLDNLADEFQKHIDISSLLNDK